MTLSFRIIKTKFSYTENFKLTISMLNHVSTEMRTITLEHLTLTEIHGNNTEVLTGIYYLLIFVFIMVIHIPINAILSFMSNVVHFIIVFHNFVQCILGL